MNRFFPRLVNMKAKQFIGYKILPLYMLDYKEESEAAAGWVPLVTIADTDQQKMLGFDKYGT